MADGTYVSITSAMNKTTLKMDLILYKMEKENIRKKKIIAKIPMDRQSIQHSFAMTNEYAIIFDPPWYVQPSLVDIVFLTNVHLQEMIRNDTEGSTRIHVVRLSDGEVTTIDAKIWSMMLHFSNAYQTDDDTIVVEGCAYENPESNPFGIFLHENIQNASGLTGHKQGSRFKRFILNLKDKTVESEDMVKTEYGSLDLPQFHPRCKGVSKNRYTYLFQLMH